MLAVSSLYQHIFFISVNISYESSKNGKCFSFVFTLCILPHHWIIRQSKGLFIDSIRPVPFPLNEWLLLVSSHRCHYNLLIDVIKCSLAYLYLFFFLSFFFVFFAISWASSSILINMNFKTLTRLKFQVNSTMSSW